MSLLIILGSCVSVCLVLLCCLSPPELLDVPYHSATGGFQSFLCSQSLSLHLMGSVSPSNCSTGLSFCQFNNYQFRTNIAKSEFFVLQRKLFPISSIFSFDHARAIFSSSTFSMSFVIIYLCSYNLCFLLMYF